MERLVVRALSALLGVQLLMFCGCVSGGGGDVASPLTIYHELLADLRSGAGAQEFLLDTRRIDVESRDALVLALRQDPLAASSIVSGCGLIDVAACYDEPPVSELQFRQPEGESFELACLRHMGNGVEGDWLLADVYFVRRDGGEWKFVAINKRYFEFIPSGGGVDDCWKD